MPGISPHDSTPAVYPIREAARLTGVHPVTLRAWERRYGLVRPRRTAKGHRLYGRGDIDRVQRICRLVASGVPVGQVGVVLAEAGSGRGAAPGDAPQFADRRALLAEAARRHAVVALDAELARGLAELPVDAWYRRVLEPAREQLRRALERGEMDSAARALFDARAELLLAERLGARSPSAAAAGQVWLAPLPEETDRLAVLAQALACADAGLRAVVVTGPEALEALHSAAAAGTAGAVVVIGRLPVAEAATENALAALAAGIPVPCLAGGPAALLGEELFTEAAFDVLPAGLAAAAAVITRRLGEPRRGPSPA